MSRPFLCCSRSYRAEDKRRSQQNVFLPSCSGGGAHTPVSSSIATGGTVVSIAGPATRRVRSPSHSPSAPSWAATAVGVVFFGTSRLSATWLAEGRRKKALRTFHSGMGNGILQSLQASPCHNSTSNLFCSCFIALLRRTISYPILFSRVALPATLVPGATVKLQPL